MHQDKKVEVSIIPLKHKIWCTGFLFREKPKLRKLIIEKVEQYNIPQHTRKSIKEGNDYYDETNGRQIQNQELTLSPSKPLSYAYCADTAYSEKIIPFIEHVFSVLTEISQQDMPRIINHLETLRMAAVEK